MEKLIIFILLSIPVVIISWRSLFNFRSHGYYRFLSWECILWLFVLHYRYWFVNPLGILQIISWILLVLAAYFVIAGVLKMKRAGKASKYRDEKGLYQFERTTQLIDTGIFQYIRHPLYASLLYLTWGIFFKHASFAALPVSLLATFFLFITARYDEKECVAFFGDQYRDYMTRTRMFIPYVF